MIWWGISGMLMPAMGVFCVASLSLAAASSTFRLPSSGDDHQRGRRERGRPTKKKKLTFEVLSLGGALEEGVETVKSPSQFSIPHHQNKKRRGNSLVAGRNTPVLLVAVGHGSREHVDRIHHRSSSSSDWADGGAAVRNPLPHKIRVALHGLRLSRGGRSDRKTPRVLPVLQRALVVRDPLPQRVERGIVVLGRGRRRALGDQGRVCDGEVVRKVVPPGEVVG